MKRILLYPSKLKIWFFTNAEGRRLGLVKTRLLLDIGAVFTRAKLWVSAKAKTKSSICLGIFLAMFSLTGCMGPSVQARSFYTSRRDLASFVIDTPDPEKSTKRLGQKIWVTWQTPSYDEETHLDITLRFVDGRERKEVHPITSKIGEMYIQISPHEVVATGGLLSYKILLAQKDNVLAATKHKLWVEKIEITETK